MVRQMYSCNSRFVSINSEHQRLELFFNLSFNYVDYEVQVRDVRFKLLDIIYQLRELQKLKLFDLIVSLNMILNNFVQKVNLNLTLHTTFILYLGFVLLYVLLTILKSLQIPYTRTLVLKVWYLHHALNSVWILEYLVVRIYHLFAV